jgi:hypothetical protein
MLIKDRCKTTAGFFVIPLLSQLWEEKNYCERRNELSSWRPVALPNRQIHLYLFKLGCDVHALLSSVIYILSGENITAVFTISRRRWDQNTTQVANRLDTARATYVWLLHVPPWFQDGSGSKIAVVPGWRWFQDGGGSKMAVVPRWRWLQDGGGSRMSAIPAGVEQRFMLMRPRYCYSFWMSLGERGEGTRL